jgi:hypothetical protein
MDIQWNINREDIQKVQDFLIKHKNPFVEKVINRNVLRQNILLDRDSLIRNILMCLVTSQQKSGPNTPVGIFLNRNPFPVNYTLISKDKNIEALVKKILIQNGLTRYINKIPVFFAENFRILENSGWKIFSTAETELMNNGTKEMERNIADQIHEMLKGFGPKQSRNLLQALGLTKYEVPIDSRITSWLNEFGFPIQLSATGLQDKAYYHFVSDGFQALCKQVDVYPCVLDAAIFSSFDNGQWTKENSVY